MRHTNPEGEGEVEKQSKELWAETPRETSDTQSEQDSESLDSEDLYLEIPRADDTTDVGKPPLKELEHSSFAFEKRKIDGKFRKYSLFVIFLLFISLGVLTYMVLHLNAQLKDNRTLLVKNQDELKVSRERSERIQNALEKKLNEKDSFMNQQHEERNEKMNELVLSISRIAALTGNADLLKAVTNTFGEKIKVDDELEIVRILIVAASNNHLKFMSYIFGIFSNDILMHLQYPPENNHYEAMYKALESLLDKILIFAPGNTLDVNKHFNNLILEFFQKYGPFIVSYERYMFQTRGLPKSISIFDKALSKLIIDENVECMGIIQDIQQENISNQYTDNENDSIKTHIRQRAQSGFEYLKQCDAPEEKLRLYFKSMLTDEDQEQV